MGNGDSVLDAGLAALVRVSGTVPGGDPAEQRRALERAEEMASPGEVEEVLVQSYLFVGFPLALSAMATWRDLEGGGPPEPLLDDPTARGARGEGVCRRVYGEQYTRLRRNIGRLHPDLDRWMVEEGYGKVISRPGLGLRERELCIVALLAVLGVEVQLYSHLRGALRVGASTGEVQAVLDQVADLIPADRRDAVGETWEEVRRRVSPD
jgi:4-carboxymuconolactone decarboxylase